MENYPKIDRNEETKTSLTAISPIKKRKVFNLDQEIIIETGSLIMLKDVSIQRPIPRFTSRVAPLIKNQSKEGQEYKNLANNDSSLVTEYPSRLLTEQELNGQSPKIKRKVDEEKIDVDIFKEDIDEAKEARAKKYEKLTKFLDNKYFQVLMFFLIFWSLFSDDVRHLGLSISVDPVYNVITIAAFIIFSIEIILNSIARPEYRWNFFFWLDCLSTVTVLMSTITIISIATIVNFIR